MKTPISILEKHDIQSLVFTGHQKLPAATYVILETSQVAAAKTYLAGLAERISTSERRHERDALQVAISAGGLDALGLPAAALASFPREFQEGIAGHEHRSRVLGDTGSSDPRTWAWGGANTRKPHVLLMIFALDQRSLSELMERERQAYSTGFAQVYVRDTVNLPKRKEHFGFADGIAQPRIREQGVLEQPGSPLAEPGEFVFGYRDEYGQIPIAPRAPAELDAEQILGSARDDREAHDLGRNGSFLVVRQLAQDVARFWQAMDEYARLPDGRPDRERAVYLAAKCVGRWPSGAPLVKSPERDDERFAADNDFAYHELDQGGLRCPVGAHIRRTNPRDSLEPGAKESLDSVDHHRILRRGRSYGPALAPFEKDVAGTERGLFFMCINVNIRRQFEFIQQTWINNPKFAGLSDDKDPLLGDQDPETGGTFTIPESPVRQRLLRLPRFVTVRGGEYFFLPSVRALRFLGQLARA